MSGRPLGVKLIAERRKYVSMVRTAGLFEVLEELGDQEVLSVRKETASHEALSGNGMETAGCRDGTG